MLGQGHVSWQIILRIFRIFEILGFESRFRPVVSRGHYWDAGDGFERLSDVVGIVF